MATIGRQVGPWRPRTKLVRGENSSRNVLIPQCIVNGQMEKSEDMEGRSIQEQVRALKMQIATIQKAEDEYKRNTSRTSVDRAKHKARIEALDRIKLQLVSLSKKGMTQ